MEEMIVILLFAIALGFNYSKNKKIKTVGFVLSVLTIIIRFMWISWILAMNPMLTIIIYIIILFGIFAFIYKKYRNFKYQRESYKDINYLNRDISTEYPPSIVGYLFHQKLRYKDLKEEKCIALFPEGTRNGLEKGEKVKDGVAFFAIRSGAKVVPCGIKGGTKEQHKITITYGKPLDYSEYKGSKDKEVLDKVTEEIMSKIIELAS